MLLNTSIITRYATGLKIAIHVLGAGSLVAAVVWFLVLLVQIIVKGLRLLIGAWQEMNTLVASLPALHFLLLVALACGVIVVTVWLLRVAFLVARWGVHYV